jgi:hypothetical protein
MSYAGALIGASLYELFIEFHWPPAAAEGESLLTADVVKPAFQKTAFHSAIVVFNLGLTEFSATEEITLIKEEADHVPPILAYGTSPIHSHAEIKP